MLVKQAANVLDLLEYFATRQQPATLAEISLHFGWPRSSTFNLLGTLSERGFLYEPASRGSFYPTPRWRALAEAVAGAEPLPQVVQDLLEEVWRATNETTVILAPMGPHAVFLETIESRQAVRYSAYSGKLVPIHTTASGQALLSLLPEAERKILLRKISYPAYTKTSLTDAQEVEAAVKAGIKRGWFESVGGFTADLGGIAVPISYPDRRLAILVGGPIDRVRPRYAALAKIIQQAMQKLGLPRAGQPARKP
ncbi:MAG TPA: IclR family transcriptional regulator [Bordetella sp.]